jgi:hypothetical protein
MKRKESMQMRVATPTVKSHCLCLDHDDHRKKGQGGENRTQDVGALPSVTQALPHFLAVIFLLPVPLQQIEPENPAPKPFRS